MSLPNTRVRTVRPTHPDEILREDFLPDYGLTVSSFANAIGVSRQTVNELLRERRGAVELWGAAEAIKKKIERIHPLNAA